MGYYTEADEDASGGEADRTLIFFSHGPSSFDFRVLSHSGGHRSLTRTMEGRKGMSRIRKTKIEFDAYFLVSILAHYGIPRAKWQSRRLSFFFSNTLHNFGRIINRQPSAS